MGAIQSIPDIIRLLKRRFWLILTVAVLGSILSAIVALNQPKTYEATAVIQIETPNVGGDVTGEASATDANHRLQLIEQRLMARDNLIELIDRHDLFANTPQLPMVQQIANLRTSVRIEPIRVAVPGTPGATAPSGLSVTVALGDPDKAAIVANDLVDTVITQNRARRVEAAQETLAFFSAEEDRIRERIVELETRIETFKRENADTLPGSVAVLRDEMRSLNETLLAIDQDIVTLETEAAQQREEVFARQLDLLTDRRTLVTERIARIEAAIAQAPRVERELSVLNRNLTQLQDRLSTVNTARVEAEMASMLEARQQQERFEILETAIPPQFAVSASRKKMALAGGVASLLAGLALAFVLEVMNPALRSAAQLEAELDITPVVTIPVLHPPRRRGKRLALILGLLSAAGVAVAALFRPLQERLTDLRLLSGN